MVSPEVRKIVRKMVSNQKEKEHFPPDPLFEKNKKALPLSRECGARAHTHARGERLVEARRRLTEAGLARLLPVLDQIVLNGKNRKKSIRSLAVKWRIPVSSARVKYYRGVANLTMLFSPNKIKGETDIEKC